MTTISHRANLSSAVFPMTLADAGRTVIAPQYDQNFDRRVDPAGEQKDAGIPQAIYMENVIPTVNGFQSVGYIPGTVLPEVVGSTMFVRWACFIDGAIVLSRGYSAGAPFEDVVSNNIKCDDTWQTAVGVIPEAVFGGSIAKVRGVNYWCDKTHLFTFTVNSITKRLNFTNVTGSVTGVTVTNIKSICSSYNYLILLMEDGTIHWSSTTTPTNFTASLVTGAGSQVPHNSTGSNFLVEHSQGFMIYGSAGVIFAQYTGNSRYPFKFVSVADAGGFTREEQISGSSLSAIHYGINDSNKIQLIDKAAAAIAAPEVSTYLERKLYKDVFNYTTNVFSKQVPTSQLISTRIFYLLDRYVVVSVQSDTNAAGWDYAFIYDTLLQRYGVLKVLHSYVFADEKSICFVPREVDAIPYVLALDVYSTTATFAGVLLLGKFQFVRDRFLQLEEINIESVKDISSGGTQNFSLLLFPSFDGKNFSTPITLTPTITNSLIQAKLHKTAKSHSIMLKGAFDVNTLELHFRVAGER
jgi:hypothetical protein